MICMKCTVEHTKSALKQVPIDITNDWPHPMNMSWTWSGSSTADLECIALHCLILLQIFLYRCSVETGPVSIIRNGQFPHH